MNAERSMKVPPQNHQLQLEVTRPSNIQYNQNPHQRGKYVESAPDNFSYSPEYKIPPPYGMRFGEENQVMQKERNQYKKDLDYLIGLRRPYGDMTQKEWEEYNRKINYMNDRYAYGELDKRNFLRGMNRGYEDEANMRKEEERRRKLEEDELDRKRLEGISEQEALENRLRQEAKQRLLKDQLTDLDNYNRKKELDNLRKAEEGRDNLRQLEEGDKMFGVQYMNYRNKILDNNNRIFGRVSKYNNMMGYPIDNDAFKAKNDFEFNRYVAEQRERERDAKRRNPEGVQERIKELEDIKESDRKMYQDKLNNQKLYKEYLDNQNEVNYLAKINKPPEDTRPQLLMPAYWYPNRPIPLYKKAKDSLLFSKNPNLYFDKDMKRFFNWDSQYSTLMDYDNAGKYLGDSKLRHNPITCPVNDYYYNKYVNRLKKNSEYVPSQNSRSQPNMIPQTNRLTSNGEEIMK